MPEIKRRSKSKGGAKRTVAWKNGQGSFTFKDVPPEELHSAVVELLSRGCMVMFMSSRDGGVRAIKVRHDDLDEPPTMWLNSASDFNSAVDAVLVALDADD